MRIRMLRWIKHQTLNNHYQTSGYVEANSLYDAIYVLEAVYSA